MAGKDNYYYDTKSDLAKHVCWKERLTKEEGAYLRSMEKCLSMGMIHKVPVISEEFARLTQEEINDPHRLFKAINDPNNAKGSYFFKMKAFFEKEKEQNERKKNNKIDFGFQSKQIADIEYPFGKFPVPNLKTINVNPIEQEKYDSLPPMNTNYRPQRKQYSPKEVKKYMTSTIDLSQPDFTYCPIKNIEKHSEYVRMQQAYEADRKFTEKYAQLVYKTNKENEVKDRKRREEEENNSRKNGTSEILLRNSMYILPNLNEFKSSDVNIRRSKKAAPFPIVKDPPIFHQEDPVARPLGKSSSTGFIVTAKGESTKHLSGKLENPSTIKAKKSRK